MKKYFTSYKFKLKSRKRSAKNLKKKVRRKKQSSKNRTSNSVLIFDLNKFIVPYNSIIQHLVNHKGSIKQFINISYDGTYKVPSNFSITENPDQSFKLIYSVIFSIIDCRHNLITIDYEECSKIDLDAQVVLDIFLKYGIDLINDRKKKSRYDLMCQIRSINHSLDVKRMLYTCGSFSILRSKKMSFDDIIPYELCVCDLKSFNTTLEAKEQSEVHTTEMVDYIQACLKRLNRSLSSEALRDFSQVIGEILDNAQDHSTIPCRFSIGYFQEKSIEDENFGIFNLVILNLGQTIYEKFKDPNCPTKHIVEQMEDLSRKYTRMGWLDQIVTRFMKNKLTEEVLWTLYALQEGITSNANYSSRGNGSIRFIESFFNLRTDEKASDDLSLLTIRSGNTFIKFDGTYGIFQRERNGETFKYISFNKENDIEKRPDNKFVTFAPQYFPGTMIFARIKIGKEDTNLL